MDIHLEERIFFNMKMFFIFTFLLPIMAASIQIYTYCSYRNNKLN